jgi:hypothetical protein
VHSLVTLSILTMLGSHHQCPPLEFSHLPKGRLVPINTDSPVPGTPILLPVPVALAALVTNVSGTHVMCVAFVAGWLCWAWQSHLSCGLCPFVFFLLLQ